MFKKMNMLNNLALVTQIGISMSVPIVAMILIGNWLDEKFNTSGILLIICILVGIYAGFRNTYVLIKRRMKADSKINRKKDNY